MSTTKEALRAMATDGKSLKPAEQIKLKVDGLKAQIARAIPATLQKYLTPERITRLFWAEARRNPTLLKCDPNSICSALVTSAQLGLEIGMMGQGYIVPYWNSKARRYEAQFIPGYKGLIALARRSGDVLSIETHLVYEKDVFRLQLGLDAVVEHTPYLDGDRGPVKLVYGVARFRDGGHHFEWMPMSEVLSIRDNAPSARDRDGKLKGPWKDHEEQMVRKTLIRRMSNYLPMSIEFQNALTLDDAASAGKRAVLDGEFVETDDEENAEGFDASVDTMAGDDQQAADTQQSQPAQLEDKKPDVLEQTMSVATAAKLLGDFSDIEKMAVFADSLSSEIRNSADFAKAFRSRIAELKGKA